MKYMFDFDEIGKLEMNKVFFASNYPILFSCINEKREYFLCVCCKSTLGEKKWLVTKVIPDIFIDLLSDKITIRDAFLRGDGRYSIYLKDNMWEIQIDNYDDWEPSQSIYLPTAGEFMDAEDDEFEEEIRYFEEVSKENKEEYKEGIDITESFVGKFVQDIHDEYDKINIGYKSILEDINVESQIIKILLNETKAICFSLHSESRKMAYDNAFMMNTPIDMPQNGSKEYKGKPILIGAA